MAITLSTEPETLKVKITRVNVELDPHITIYNVELSSGSGVWPETFGSETGLRTFLRGVEAGASLAGRVRLERWEISHKPKVTLRVPRELLDV